VGGGTSSGNGVFLGKFLEGNFLGLFDGGLLLHDGVLDGFLLGDHGAHSVVLLLESFSKEFYLVGFGGSGFGEIVNVLLLNRDGVGAAGLLGDLGLEESSELLVLLEVLDTLGDKDLSLSDDFGEGKAGSGLGLEELLESVELVSGATLVEDKVHVVPSTTGGTSISDKRATGFLPGGGLVLERGSGLYVFGLAGRCSLSNDRGGRGRSNGNDGSGSELELESGDKGAALGDGVESLVGDEVGVGGDVVGSASGSVNDSRLVSVRLAVVTSESHVERSEDGDSTEGFEAGLNGSQLGVSGSVSALNLGGERGSGIRRELRGVLSALLDSVDHTGGSEA
jgi:hypothetical protein